MSPRRKPAVEIVADDAAPTMRDYVMARIAAARAAAQSVVDGCDDMMALFVDPDEDDEGEDRKELLAGALEAAGCAARALECAEGAIDKIDPLECEPWDDDSEDADDADDDDDPPEPRRRKR